MFDSVRKHQRVLLFIIVVLIFPAFAFFGIQGYDRMFSDGDSVARVEGERISRTDFEQAQREQFDRIRQMFGASIDPQMFDTPSARRELLEGLIDQRVLSVHARDSRITVSDDRLREAIAGIPGLARPDGTFDLERYRAYVASRGRNEAFKREHAMRRSWMGPASLVPSAWLCLGVLPGTGGLTRLVDKRHIRRDHADVFSTMAEGLRGKRAKEWRLVDDVIARSKFAEAGLEITGCPPEALAQLLRQDADRYGRTLRESGVKPE